MASIGDINNLQDKENLDIDLVPTHYFDAQGNKRNIAEDVAAIYQAINGKAASSHTHDTLVDHNSASAVVALSWAGSAVSSVTPDGSNTRSSSKYLVAVYLDNGTPVFKDVDVGNVKVGDADKVDGYHILVNQTVTARTDAIFFL